MTQSGITHEDRSPLIDLDVLVYRCGFAADSQVKAQLKQEGLDGEDLEVAMADYDYTHHALGNVKQVIHEIRSKFRGPHRGFLTGHGNFREQVATILPYKGNRPERKPKYYKEIQQYMRDVHDAEIIHGREADDALASAQWAAKDKSTIICSIDKDLLSVPGWNYNWVRNELRYVTLAEANLFHFKQMLEGDRTDNIPGIKGVGPVTIEKLCEDCGHQLEPFRSIVQQQYQKQYGERWREAYEEVSRLLWIERVEGQGCPFL